MYLLHLLLPQVCSRVLPIPWGVPQQCHRQLLYYLLTAQIVFACTHQPHPTQQPRMLEEIDFMHGKEINLHHFLFPLLKTVRMVGGHKVRHLDLTQSKEGGFGNLYGEGQNLPLIGHHMFLACNRLCDLFKSVDLHLMETLVIVIIELVASIRSVLFWQGKTCATFEFFWKIIFNYCTKFSM
jgi:hypothetical protein